MREILWLRPSEIQLHPEAKRSLEEAHVNRMRKAGFDEEALGVITVCHRAETPNDKTLYSLNGWHRRNLAIEERFGGALMCVYVGVKTDAQAAELFSKLNTFRAVHVYDKWRNDVVAGKADAVRVSEECASRGLEVVKGKGGSGTIRAVAKLRQLAAESRERLVWVLDVLTGAWGLDPAGFHENLLIGLSLLKAHCEEEDIPMPSTELAKKLATRSPTTLTGTGKNTLACAQAIAVAWDYKRQYDGGNRVGTVKRVTKRYGKRRTKRAKSGEGRAVETVSMAAQGKNSR